jgi:Tol biopolymer transport system component
MSRARSTVTSARRLVAAGVLIAVVFLCASGPASAAAGDVMVASVSTGGVLGNGNSGTQAGDPGVAISADGCRIVFESDASNLTAPLNGQYGLVMRDRCAGTTTLVDAHVFGSPADSAPAISADGNIVAWVSYAAINPADTNNFADVYAKNLSTGVVTRVSAASDGGFGPSVSGDGHYVAYLSRNPLTSADTNQANDIFVRDMVGGGTVLASTDNAGDVANAGREAGSNSPSISSDGRYVAFLSDASNLVAGDTNGRVDVFVRDLVAHTTLRVSVSIAGDQADGNSFQPSISGNGGFVVFRAYLGRARGVSRRHRVALPRRSITPIGLRL